MNADFLFVLDISHSIINKYLNVVFHFVGKFAKDLTIGRLDDRVGVIVYGNRGHIMFNLSKHQNKDSFLDALKQLQTDVHKIQENEVQQTNTSDELTKAISLFQSDTRQSNTVYRAAIVVSDGVSDDPDATIRAAEELHSLIPAVLVYAIGVGRVKEEEMIAIAGDVNHYTHLHDFDPEGFHRIRKDYLKDICLNGNCCRQVSQFITLFPRAVKKYINPFESFDEELGDDEIARYVTFVPTNDLSIRVCSNKGRVTIFVFSMDQEQSGYLRSFKPICDHRNSTDCKCVQVYIPEYDSSSEDHSRRRARRETVIIEVHITIEGMESENEFVMNTTDGDDPNDCVGMKIASDCEDPNGMNRIFVQ